MKKFAIGRDTPVVTSTYVTQDGHPITYVSRGTDANGDEIWQFHADNGDYRVQVLQLVGLGAILEIDPGLTELAELPIGFAARRTSRAAGWIIAPDEP